MWPAPAFASVPVPPPVRPATPGVLFVPLHEPQNCCPWQRPIRDTEQRQASRMRDGVTLHSQVQFDTYLARRRLEPSPSFREHRRTVGGAIEEQPAAGVVRDAD